MRRLSVLAVLLVTTCLAAASCSATPGRSDVRAGHSRFADNATFTYGLTDDLGAFDPYHNNPGGIAYLAYDSLVNLEPDGSFASGLAMKWKADARSATFVLRPGITCSDGKPLTASQVAADLKYVSDPENKSQQYGTNTPTVALTTTGDDTTRTVKVSTKEPFGFLLRTLGNLPIVCANGLRNPKILASRSDGTGPFVLTSVVPGQSYTFTVRKDYKWGPGGASTSAPGTPTKVVLRVVTNETTRANLLLSGELNFARVGGEDQRRLTAQGVANVEVPNSGAWLWPNQLGGRPTADKRVRAALVQALDLDSIVKVNTGGSGSVATGLINREPKPCGGNTVSGLLPRQNVAAARLLLDRAGWAKSPGGVRRKAGRTLTVDLHYAPAYGSSFDKPTAELIAEQWKALGVHVELTPDTITGFAHVAYETHNYDVYMLGFGSDLPSQMVKYLSGPVPPKGNNIAGINNQKYNALATKAIGMTVPAACMYWNKAEQTLWRDLDVIPIATRPWVYFERNVKVQVAGTRVPLPMSIRMLD